MPACTLGPAQRTLAQFLEKIEILFKETMKVKTNLEQQQQQNLPMLLKQGVCFRPQLPLLKVQFSRMAQRQRQTLTGRLKSTVLQLPVSTRQPQTIPYNLIPSPQYKHISTTREFLQPQKPKHYKGTSFSAGQNLSRKGQLRTPINEEPQKGSNSSL